MVTSRVHAAARSGARPCSSLPNTRATGLVFAAGDPSADFTLVVAPSRPPRVAAPPTSKPAAPRSRGEGGRPGHAPTSTMLKPAPGPAMRRVVRPRRSGVVRNHEARHAEKGRRARDRAQVVGVANAVQDERRLAPAGPRAEVLRRWRAQRGRRHDRDNAAVMNGTGDLLELGRLDAAINFLRLREHLAHHPHLPPGRIVENSRWIEAGSRAKRARTAASPQIF